MKLTTWDEKAESSEALQLLAELPDELEAIKAPKDQAAMEGLERLKAVILHLNGLLSTADNQLLTDQFLTSLASPLGSIKSQIDSYTSDGDASYIEAANTYADQALDATGAVVIPTLPTQDAEGLRKAAESFRRSAGQLVRGLTDEVESVRELIKEQRTELDQQVEKLGEQLTGFSTHLEAQKQTLDQHIQTFQTEFASAQDERKAAFQSHIEEQQDAFKEALDSTTEKGNAEVQAFKESGTSTLSDLEEMKEKAEILLDAIGKTGTEFGFKQYAQEEKDQANFWRWIAVVSLSLIAGVGIWVLATHPEGDVDFSYSVLRLVITIPLGALAAYAGRQSYIHRENERANRSLHLDIAAIDPYIALLPDKEQQQLKAEMARRIFGHRYIPRSGKGATTAPLDDVITKATESGE